MKTKETKESNRIELKNKGTFVDLIDWSNSNTEIL